MEIETLKSLENNLICKKKEKKKKHQRSLKKETAEVTLV